MLVPDQVRHGVAYMLRRLRRSPTFAVVAILILGAGIGVSTAVFSLVDAAFLRPLQLRDPAQLIVLLPTRPTSPTDRALYTRADYRDFRAASHTLSDLAAFDMNGAFPQPVGPADNAEPVNAVWVSGTFTQTVGVRPVIGDGFTDADSRAGSELKALISYRYWQRAYGGRPRVIGRTIVVYGLTRRIVGVLPPSFDFPRSTDIWAPLPDTLSDAELAFVGRLRPGATAADARRELDAFMARSGSPDPPEMHDVRATSMSLQNAIVGPARPIMLALTTAVGLLLLMTGVNVATLVAGRAVARDRDVSLRMALGASRRAASAELMWECALLAFLGGAVGIGIAQLVLHSLLLWAPPELPRLDAVRIDGRAVVFCTLVSVAAAAALGLAVVGAVTAGAASRVQLGVGLRGRTARVGLSRWPRRLVVSQVAMAVVALAGAGLTLRSLDAITHVRLGFVPDRLLIARLFPASAQVQSDSAWRRAVTTAVAAIGATPGVAAATPMIAPPFTGVIGFDVGYLLEGQPASAMRTNPLVALYTATPTSLRALGIPLVAGRTFAETDRAGSPPVASVSVGLARMLWPGRDPVGRRISIEGPTGPWRTIVGVVGDTRYRDLESERPTLYLADAQAGISDLVVAVRTRRDPTALIPTVRHVLSASAPGMGVVGVAPVMALAAPVLARPRFAALLLSAIAGAALLLAAAGLYGVLATLVEERRQEIGIRVALGAVPAAVALLVLRQGALLALLGTVIGTGAALLGTRVLGALLYDVTPTDPLTLAAVVAVLATTAVAACLVPARRAIRVDPLVAIRAE